MSLLSDEANPTSAEATALLERFAQVAEQVASTTKKLEKAAFVGDYLKELGDTDLARAARYFAGHQFAQNDARTTNVGGSIISAALSEATGFSQQELAPIYVRLGDAGVQADSCQEGYLGIDGLPSHRDAAPLPVVTRPELPQDPTRSFGEHAMIETVWRRGWDSNPR